MEILSKLQEILKSIFVIKFYRKIYDQSFKRSFIYVLIFSLIIYICGAFFGIIKADNFIKNELKLFVSSLPKVSINDGRLDVGLQEPQNVIAGSKKVIVDTLNSIDLSQLNNKGWYVVFRERDMAAGIFGYYKVISYDWIMSIMHIKSIDKDYLLNLIPILSAVVKRYVTWFYIVGYLFWLFFYKSISILIFSLIGQLLNVIQSAKLKYSQILNISMYAITLPWIIKLIYDIFDTNFKFADKIYIGVYWIIAITYLYLVIRDIKQYRKKLHEGKSPYNVVINV